MPVALQQSLAPLLVTILWGINAALVKLMVQQFPPLELQALRMAVAAVVLVPLAFSRGRGATSPRALRLAMWAAICSVVLHQILLGYAMTLGKAGLGSLILGLNPLTTAVLAHFAVGERMTLRHSLGALIGFGGVMAAVRDEWLQSGAGVGLGELLFFGAMLAYVLGSLCVKKAQGLASSMQLTVMIQVIGGVMLAVPALVRAARYGPPPIPTNPVFWLMVLASGALSTAYGNYVWNRSIQELGAARTSMFVNVMPFASLISAAALLGEAIRPSQLVGLLAVIGGVYLGTTQKQLHRATL